MSELRCKHCGYDIRNVAGKWLDLGNFAPAICDGPQKSAMHEPITSFPEPPVSFTHEPL